MAVPIQTVSLKTKLVPGEAVQCSEDGLYSVLCQDGVYILSIGKNEASFSSLPIIKYCIPKPKEVVEWEAAVSKEELLQQMTYDRWTELLLDPILNPKMSSSVSFTGPRRVSWSPSGADPLHRCVLATLSEDHRLCVYSQDSNASTWTKATDLTASWFEYVKQHEYVLDSDLTFPNLMDRISYHGHIKAMQEMAWYPQVLIQSTSGYIVLAVVLKSGHLVLWSFRLPLFTMRESQVVGLCRLSESVPTAVHWIPFGVAKSALCVVAYDNGLIEGIHVNFDDLDSGGIAVGQRVTLWTEEDFLTVYCLKWCDMTRTLLAGKGSHLIRIQLSCSEIEEGHIHSFTIEHETVNSRLPINSISLRNGRGFLSTGDNRVFHVNLAASSSIGEAYRSTEPTMNKHHSLPVTHWLNHGLALSPSAVFLILLNSPGVQFDHLKEREPVKIQIFSLIEPSQALNTALQITAGCSDVNIVPQDLLASLRLTMWSNNFSWSDPRMTSVLSLQSQLSISSLQLTRSILCTKMAIKNSKLKEREEAAEIAEQINKAEELILCQHASKILHTLPDLPEVSHQDKITVSILCQFLKLFDAENSSEVVKQSLSKAKLQLASDIIEICQICESAVEFTNIRRDSCANGHMFERCCQTLTLCQSMEHRRCVGCGAYALPLFSNDLWVRSLQTSRCGFCSDYLTNP